MKMDYVRYDNQATPPTTVTWNLANPSTVAVSQPTVTSVTVASTTGAIPQQTPIMPQQPPPPPTQQNIKPEPQPVVYGTSQPIATYDMSVGWAPQMVPQNVIQVPQWPATTAHHHPVSIDPNGIGPAPLNANTCLHPTALSTQSHYNQYHSTLPPSGPSPVNTAPYWNSDLLNSQQQQPTTTITTLGPPQQPPLDATSSLSTGLLSDGTASESALIENAFTLGQPSVSSAIQQSTVGLQPVVQAPAAQQHQPAAVYDDQLAMGSSSQIGQPVVLPEGPGSLEDALEVIKSHAEHFPEQRQTCSSTSGDDDDDHSRGPRSGEREKERRQANNARER